MYNIKINFEHIGLENVVRRLDALAASQIPYAQKQTLNRLAAEEVKPAIVETMKKVFDRPTPYTLNSLYVKYATKQRLESVVYLKDESFKGTPATKYLSPQIEGGARQLKRFERALQNAGALPANTYITPGPDCPLDIYGNIPNGLIIQILSYFRAFGEQGYRANITEKRREKLARGTKKARGYRYFISRGPGTETLAGNPQHLQAGIYKSTSFAWGSAVQLIFMFIKPPKYKKRLPYYEIAQQIIDAKWQPIFAEELRRATASAEK
ncbi:MAG: hypothetical protein PHS64_00280 [Candidatus Omnitrophica bacterium]|nr:hypothetical protein [Candidatus Omnitrophota bacterium]